MIAETSTYHTPVLLMPSVDSMDIRPGGKYVDLTFGGGGHSREILSRLTSGAHLYGFDQDADAEQNIPAGDERFTFVRSNFRYLKNFMRFYGIDGKVDAVLADLGVSSHHFDDTSRGFSFRADGPLDMRMNRRAKATAADIVNTYDETALADLFHTYGEMQNSRQLARAIVAARNKEAINTIGQFLNTVQPLFNPAREKKDMAKVFQALRIEVNQEMQALNDMLKATIDVLRPGGRLVVITYHSLEDRMVKNIMRTGNVEGKETKDFFGRTSSPYTPITRKPITPSAEEQNENPRSRSAKLRVAVRNQDEPTNDRTNERRR